MIVGQSMEATGAKDYRRECKYGGKCYQKNPEHKSKFKHSAREQDEKENRENQADVADTNKRQHSDSSEDIAEAKKARNLQSSDPGDVVDAKEVRHHDLSESEKEDTSQDEGA